VQEKMEDEIACAYELSRQRNIRRNLSVMASLGIGESDEFSKEPKLDRKRRAASSRTQNDNLCLSESEDIQHKQSPRKKAGMDYRFRTQRKSSKLDTNYAGDIEEKVDPNFASDTEEKPTFEPGQKVWSQYNDIDGPRLWPAKVLTQRGDMITVEWENPEGENPTFVAHHSKLRARPVCGCGNCRVLFLADDNALLKHNKVVECCASFSESSRNENCR
jgi:hypothetical protein